MKCCIGRSSKRQARFPITLHIKVVTTHPSHLKGIMTMLFTTNGIVIRERIVGENDKFIDVLTDKFGVIELSCKGVKKLTSKNSPCTQLFAYSKLCFLKKGERYILNSAEPIKIFYDIRLNIEKLSLASYFCEVVGFCIPANQQSDIILRLVLNSLFYLSNSSRDLAFIKSVFELRLMTEIGMMPDVVACKNCAIYSSKSMYFNINDGFFLCENCFVDSNFINENYIEINETVLHCIRFICYSDFEKIFNFKVTSSIQSVLSKISELYILSQLNRSFKTLEFYKAL